MTLSTDVMAWIWNYFGAVYPPPRTVVNTTKAWPASLPNISLVVIDVMVYLRNTSYAWEDDAPVEAKMTCLSFAHLVADIAENLLRDNPTQIKTVVMRFDRPGKTTVAKGAIYEERYDRIDEYVLPGDGSNPFYDDAFMPFDIHGIFKNSKARSLLYVYLTQFFLNQFRGIGVGQEVIIDGGLRMIGDRGLPFRIFFNDDIGSVDTQSMDEKYYLAQGEADLGAPFWSSILNQDVILCSEDGDAITIGLIQSLKRVNEDGTLTGPRMIVRKRLTSDNIAYEDEELERRLELKQTFPQTSLSRSIRTPHYVDIDELRDNIIHDSSWYGGRVDWCPFPVEMFCVLAIMPKSDFFKSIPKMQFTTIWNVFIASPKEFGKMVIVDVENPASTCVDPSPMRPLRYGIVRSIFMRFVWACLKKGFAKSRHCGTLSSMLKDITVQYDAYKPKHPVTGEPPKNPIPTIGRLDSAAANLAWCLAYFSNGSIPETLHKLDYPLAKDKDGNSLHGWDTTTSSNSIYNVKFADSVVKKDVYWAM